MSDPRTKGGECPIMLMSIDAIKKLESLEQVQTSTAPNFEKRTYELLREVEVLKATVESGNRELKEYRQKFEEATERADDYYSENRLQAFEISELRKAMEFSIAHLKSMESYSIVDGAIHTLETALKNSILITPLEAQQLLNSYDSKTTNVSPAAAVDIVMILMGENGDSDE